MAFPGGVFPRVKIGKARYMDGGASDNTPIYPLLIYNCENLFVAHLRPVPRERGLRILRGNSLKYWRWEINLQWNALVSRFIRSFYRGRFHA